MTAAVGLAVAALTSAVAMLLLSLTAVRLRIRRRRRRTDRLQPWASTAIARFVTAGTVPARPAGRAERAMFRDVALQALADLRGSEREALVALLGRFGYLDDAAAALADPRRPVRRRAAELLAAMAMPAAGPALAAGLGDPDPLVRTSCARTLAQVGTGEMVPRVAETAEHDIQAVPGAAAAVVLALGRAHPAALAPLIGPGTPHAARMAAVTVAGRLRLLELAPALRACLADRRGDGVAAAAAQGLGMIGDVESAGALRDLASSQGGPAGVRHAAVTALGSIGDPQSVPVLEPLLLAVDWELRARAAHALGRLGEPGAAALRRAVLAGPPEASEQAAAVLGR